MVLDQISKAVIRATLDPREVVDVFPGFDISRVTNEGIAFGLFPGRQSAIAVLTVMALCAIAIALAGLVARNNIGGGRRRPPGGREPRQPASTAWRAGR